MAPVSPVPTANRARLTASQPVRLASQPKLEPSVRAASAGGENGTPACSVHELSRRPRLHGRRVEGTLAPAAPRLARRPPRSCRASPPHGVTCGSRGCRRSRWKRLNRPAPVCGWQDRTSRRGRAPPGAASSRLPVIPAHPRPAVTRLPHPHPTAASQAPPAPLLPRPPSRLARPPPFHYPQPPHTATGFAAAPPQPPASHPPAAAPHPFLSNRLRLRPPHPE